MTETPEKTQAAPVMHVAPAPHLVDRALSTRRMMLDVLIGLTPAVGVSLFVFRWYAAAQIAVCVACCLVFEVVLTFVRRRPIKIADCSAIVTGLILAFSLPATCPAWVSVIACFVAIGLGKVIFGGLGQNIFNPAMVGRAFVMIAFAGFLAAGGYVADTAVGGNITQTIPYALGGAIPDAVTQATPMTSAFKAGEGFDLARLVWGNTNGSLGETSAIALILGGLYLCIRRTASWRIPLGAIVGLVVVGGVDRLMHAGGDWTLLHHLFGGAFLLGALFIVTDPVTSPLTPKGRFIFGVIFGMLVMLIRLLTNYPEGVMFAVLLVNAVTPLINRWTIPRPVGGPAPIAAKQ